MKASARNQLVGLVASIRDGSVNDEIELQTASGLRVVATVTRASREAMGLKVGTAAMALIKASAVTLVTDADGMRFSARNQFEGVVARVNKGAVNSEVLLTLPGGEQLVAIVTNESAEGLEMAAGQKALAMFKAGSAILAVKA
ncbi:hypothetical protein GCM10027082_35050 [Comamonas humi]